MQVFNESANVDRYLYLLGLGEKPFDVCSTWRSGGAERTNKRADWEKFPAGAGKQSTKEPGQSWAVGSVPGSSAKHLPNSGHTIRNSNLTDLGFESSSVTTSK